MVLGGLMSKIGTWKCDDEDGLFIIYVLFETKSSVYYTRLNNTNGFMDLEVDSQYQEMWEADEDEWVKQ
jgi:hypothetical protein